MRIEKSIYSQLKDVKLTKLGFLKLQVHDVYKIFRLAYHGLKILTGSEEARLTIVLEDYSTKHALLEGEKGIAAEAGESSELG